MCSVALEGIHCLPKFWLLSFQATERITYGFAMPNHVFSPRKKIEDISIGTTADGARSVLCCGKNKTAWSMLRRRFAVYDFWWVLKAWRFYNFLSLYLPCLLWIWLISGGFILVVDFKWERKRCRRGQRTRTQARTQLPTDQTRISSSTIASIVAPTSSSLVPLSSLSS